MFAPSARHFHDEDAAQLFFEKCLWTSGPICPHCGGATRINLMKGNSTRNGTYKCYMCRKPFTVKVGTIFENSRVPMHTWLRAIYLITSGAADSSNQLHSLLGVTRKTVSLMALRIHQALHASSSALRSSGIDEVEAGRLNSRTADDAFDDAILKIVKLYQRWMSGQ